MATIYAPFMWGTRGSPRAHGTLPGWASGFDPSPHTFHAGVLTRLLIPKPKDESPALPRREGRETPGPGRGNYGRNGLGLWPRMVGLTLQSFPLISIVMLPWFGDLSPITDTSVTLPSFHVALTS